MGGWVRSNSYFALGTLVVVAFVVVMHLWFPDVRLGPVASGVGHLTEPSALGLTRGACCVCVWDKARPDSLKKCEQIRQDNKAVCDEFEFLETDSNGEQCLRELECTKLTPKVCKDKPLKIFVEAHSSRWWCEDFVDFSYQVCVDAESSCGEAVHDGCETFANFFEAEEYIARKSQENPCIKMTLTGNTCTSNAGFEILDGTCFIRPNSEAQCTIEAFAGCTECSFATCKFGEYCGPAGNPGDCRSAPCTDPDSGAIIEQTCCFDTGLWVPRGSCSSCDGACCTAGRGCRDNARGSIFDEPIDPKECRIIEEGIWNPGKTCAQLTCPQLGACCYTVGDSDLCKGGHTRQSCLALVNSTQNATLLAYTPGKKCNEVKCAQPRGACCVLDLAQSGQLAQCYGQKTQQQCRDMAPPFSRKKSIWKPQQTCSQAECQNVWSCKSTISTGETGHTCEECLRNNGLCRPDQSFEQCQPWAFCSSVDSFGEVCCGPI